MIRSSRLTYEPWFDACTRDPRAADLLRPSAADPCIIELPTCLLCYLPYSPIRDLMAWRAHAIPHHPFATLHLDHHAVVEAVTR